MATLRSLIETDLARKARRYFVVGGVSALTDWAFFALFYYAMDMHYLFAATLSFVIATSLNYALSIRWVFSAGRHSRGKEIALVYLVSMVGILINLGMLGALIEFLAINPMVAKVVSTISAFGWNFLARYLWIFHR